MLREKLSLLVVFKFDGIQCQVMCTKLDQTLFANQLSKLESFVKQANPARSISVKGMLKLYTQEGSKITPAPGECSASAGQRNGEYVPPMCRHYVTVILL